MAKTYFTGQFITVFTEIINIAVNIYVTLTKVTYKYYTKINIMT